MEPGHQFEWAWLLTRWGQVSGDARCATAAKRLYETGLRGIDTARGVAINALNDDFTVRDPAARLWPQTEWLKAACVLSDDAVPPAKALARYLEPAAWWDVMTEAGAFQRQPAPASSFYHIVAGCHALAAVTSVKQSL